MEHHPIEQVEPVVLDQLKKLVSKCKIVILCDCYPLIKELNKLINILYILQNNELDLYFSNILTYHFIHIDNEQQLQNIFITNIHENIITTNILNTIWNKEKFQLQNNKKLLIVFVTYSDPEGIFAMIDTFTKNNKKVDISFSEKIQLEKDLLNSIIKILLHTHDTLNYNNQNNNSCCLLL